MKKVFVLLVTLVFLVVVSFSMSTVVTTNTIGMKVQKTVTFTDTGQSSFMSNGISNNVNLNTAKLINNSVVQNLTNLNVTTGEENWQNTTCNIAGATNVNFTDANFNGLVVQNLSLLNANTNIAGPYINAATLENFQCNAPSRTVNQNV